MLLVVSELGMRRTYMAKLIGLTQPGVGYAVSRGKKIAKDKNYNLIE